MVEVDKFIVGNFYFDLHYNSPRSHVPEIWTLFYLGTNIYDDKNKKKKHKEEYYFQDAESYEQKGSILEKGNYKDCFIYALKEDQLTMIFDLNGLIVQLDELKHKIPKLKKSKGETIYIPYSKIKKNIKKCK